LSNNFKRFWIKTIFKSNLFDYQLENFNFGIKFLKKKKEIEVLKIFGFLDLIVNLKRFQNNDVVKYDVKYVKYNNLIVVNFLKTNFSCFTHFMLVSNLRITQRFHP
jgi:hypothetical protein